MLIMFLGFLPQYCCISDFDDMINILRSYEVDLNMAAHQVGGKFALWQDLWRKVDQAKRKVHRLPWMRWHHVKDLFS